MFSAIGMNGFVYCWYKLHNGFLEVTGSKERPCLSQNKQKTTSNQKNPIQKS